MSLYKLFTISIFHFQRLNEVRKIAFGKVIVYLLCLSFLLAIPLSSQVVGIFNNIQSDGQKIAKKLPDFTIESNQLKTKQAEQGFIYQSNFIIFTFDPDGKRTVKDITNDFMGNFVSIGLLKDELVVSVKSDDVTSSLLDSTLFEFRYDDPVLKHLTSDHLKERLSSKSIPWYFYLIVFMVAIYPSFFSLLFSIFFATLIGAVLIKFKDSTYTLFETLKTMIVAATVPTIISIVILSFNYSFDAGTFILLASLFIFCQMMRKLPKKSNQS